jgi:hypothetical protein
VMYARHILRLSAVAMLVFVTGCAQLRTTSTEDSDVYPSAAVRELSGTWHGSFGWVGANLYQDEGFVDLRIADDGTFTATVSPNGGANNLAKPATLAGKVVAKGNRVTLRNTEGLWTSLTLVRRGNTLFGVATDPATLANVMLRLDRDESRQMP